jgi:glutamate/aspartate transport system substrate-binding protein
MRIERQLFVFAWALLLAFGAVAQESPTLRKISETGVISLGFRDNSLPFSYLDKQQRPIGYSIELCLLVVDAIKARLKLPGLEVMFRPVTSANRISFVVNDIVDLECGSTTNTLERQKEVAFSVTTFVASSSVVSKKSDPILSLKDLQRRTVVSTAGTTCIKTLAQANQAQRLDMRIISGMDHEESFRLLEFDRAAAFAMDDVLVHGLVARSRNPADYVIYNTELSLEPYGIVVRKNDPEFKKVVDAALIDLFKYGQIHQIYRKWFLTQIPPNKIKLQLPMSKGLKKAIAFPTDSADPADYR